MVSIITSDIGYYAGNYGASVSRLAVRRSGGSIIYGGEIL